MYKFSERKMPQKKQIRGFLVHALFILNAHDFFNSSRFKVFPPEILNTYTSLFVYL